MRRFRLINAARQARERYTVLIYNPIIFQERRLAPIFVLAGTILALVIGGLCYLWLRGYI